MSQTAYYRWLRGGSYRPTQARQAQLAAVKEVFWEHKRRYGRRRVVAQLREQGHRVGCHRVLGLMRRQGLVALSSPVASRPATPTAGTASTSALACCWQSPCRRRPP